MGFDEYVEKVCNNRVVVRGTVVLDPDEQGPWRVTLAAFTKAPNDQTLLWYRSSGPVPTAVCEDTNIQIESMDKWMGVKRKTPSEFMSGNWSVDWWSEERQIVIARPIDNTWNGRWEKVGEASIILMMHLPHLLGYLKNNSEAPTAAMVFARRLGVLTRDLYNRAWHPTR